MGIGQLLKIFWARRWIIIASTMACFLSAAATGTLLPTRYTATSQVILNVIEPDPVTGQVMNSKFVDTFFTTQAELIRDYRVAGAVVDNLGWTSSPQLLEQYNARGDNDGRDFRRWLSQFVSSATNVALIPGSNILQIAYTGNNPEAARIIADEIRKAYVEQTLAYKRETATDNAAWLDQQVAKLGNDLSAAERRKAAFERENDVILQNGGGDVESARLQAMAGELERPVPAVLAQRDNTDRMQLAQMDARITSASETLGPNHPDLQALKRQREALASAVAAADRGTPAAPTGGASAAAMLKAQKARVMASREKVDELQRLQADVDLVRAQYAKVSGKAANARQQADLEDAGVTMLGSAVAPTDPVFPNWPLILLGSLATGGALGILLSLITELLSRRVRGVEDLPMINVPLLAVMPKIPARA